MMGPSTMKVWPLHRVKVCLTLVPLVDDTMSRSEGDDGKSSRFLRYWICEL